MEMFKDTVQPARLPFMLQGLNIIQKNPDNPDRALRGLLVAPAQGPSPWWECWHEYGQGLPHHSAQPLLTSCLHFAAAEGDSSAMHVKTCLNLCEPPRLPEHALEMRQPHHRMRCSSLRPPTSSSESAGPRLLLLFSTKSIFSDRVFP